MLIENPDARFRDEINTYIAKITTEYLDTLDVYIQILDLHSRKNGKLFMRFYYPL